MTGLSADPVFSGFPRLRSRGVPGCLQRLFLPTQGRAQKRPLPLETATRLGDNRGVRSDAGESLSSAGQTAGAK